MCSVGTNLACLNKDDLETETFRTLSGYFNGGTLEGPVQRSQDTWEMRVRLAFPWCSLWTDCSTDELGYNRPLGLENGKYIKNIKTISVRLYSAGSIGTSSNAQP